MPVLSTKQNVSAVPVEGGPTSYTIHGSDEGEFRQPARVIQSTNAACRDIVLKLRQLAADPAAQPITLQYDDFNAGGPFDGPYYLTDVDAPELESDFRGDLDIELGLVRLTAPVPLAGALGAAPAGHQLNDDLVGAAQWNDFLDSPSASWTITDDPGNNRTLVSLNTPGRWYTGDWAAGITYLAGEGVTYGGAVWVSAVNGNIGNAPIEGSAYWFLAVPAADSPNTVLDEAMLSVNNTAAVTGTDDIPTLSITPGRAGGIFIEFGGDVAVANGGGTPIAVNDNVKSQILLCDNDNTLRSAATFQYKAWVAGEVKAWGVGRRVFIPDATVGSVYKLRRLTTRGVLTVYGLPVAVGDAGGFYLRATTP